MEIKIDKDIFEDIFRRLSSIPGPSQISVMAELAEFIRVLLASAPGGKLKKTDVPWFFYSYLDTGLLVLEKKEKREFLRVAPEIWEKVSLNKIVVREIARQRRTEYRTKTGGKPTGAGNKKWTAKKVKELLESAGWNAAEAARIAGIKRQYISFLMKKFGIKKPS